MKKNNIPDKQQSPPKSRDSISPIECTSTSLSTTTKHKSLYQNVTGSSGDEKQNHISCKNSRKHKIKKPKDMPKRPLSAYNIFFKQERQKILASILVDNCDDNEPVSTASIKDSNLDISKRYVGTEGVEAICSPKKKYKNKNRPLPHGKISFENLAKEVGKRWKILDEDEMHKFKILADEDLYRYKQQMDEYHDNKAKKKTEAEEFIARQKLQVEARRIKNAQDLENKLRFARLQIALKQLHQEHQNVLRQILEASRSYIDQVAVMNNGVNLNTSEANLPPVLLNALSPLSSLGIPVVSPFCDMALPSNMNLYEHPQSIASISINKGQVPKTSTSSQSELGHDIVRTEENEDYLTSFLKRLDGFNK